MGETTPDAVELKCPGCETYFRLTPKKGRLPTGDVPCPKCFTEISVEHGRKIYRSHMSDMASEDTQPTSSAPGFGVMSRRPSADALDDESEDAIARLTRLAGDLPGGSKATMAGLPGGFTNPFSRDGDLDKTAAIDASVLSAIAEQNGNTTKGPFDNPPVPDPPAEDGLAESTDAGAWRRSHEHQTSPGLDEVSDVLAAEKSANEAQTRKTVDLTRQNRADLAQLRETAENKRVPRSMIGLRSGKAPDEDTLEGEVGLSDAELKSQVLARIKKKRMVARPGDDTATSAGSAGSAGSAPTSVSSARKLKLDKLRPALSGASTAEDDASSDDSEDSGKPSLAHLFKKAQKRRTSPGIGSSEDLPAPRSESPARPQPRPALPSKAQTDSATPGIDLEDSEARELAELLRDVSDVSDDTAPDSSDASSPDHSGLFDGFGAPEGASPPGRVPLPGISRERGQATSQSMLARLQARRRGPNVDPIELGTAGESRGSGYIRLPTAEIQDVLGRGQYRLRIEDIIYEPVDEAGLTQLIKGGVLLGAEELAEADGDWMPVSEHPVFGELRRKMAAEAHDVLSRIGTPRRKAPARAPATPAPREEPFSPPLPVDASSNSLDFSLLDVEQKGRESAEVAAEAASPSEHSAPELDPFMALETREPESEPLYDDAPGDVSVSQFLEDDLDGAEPGASELVEDDDDVAPLAKPNEPPATLPSSPHQRRPEDAILPDVAPASLSSEMDAAPARKKSAGGRIAGLALGAGLLAVLGAGLTAPGQAMIEDATGWNPSSLWTTTTNEEPPAPRAQQATKTAEVAGTESPTPAEALEPEAAQTPEAAPAPSPDERLVELKQRWRTGESSVDELAELIEIAGARQQWSLMRQASLAALATAPEDERFHTAHKRAVEQDPEMGPYQPQVLDAATGLNFAGNYSVDTHRGWIFKLPGSEDEVIFKPSRQGWEDGWQMEIASWRLCELIACNFEIIKTTPALLHEDALIAALDAASGDIDTAQAQQLRELASWQAGEGDGTSRVVRGSLERLPASSRAPFPIEYRPLWIDWLTATSSPAPLERPLSEELSSIASLADGKFQQPLVDAIGQQPTSEVARDVSSLLLFDYLTNNWERFSTRAETYGLNNPVIGNSIVSRHNGDAFQPRASRRVQGRFEWTTRFSRSTVATIRLLERDTLEAVLFPEAGPVDRARLNVLWSQREDLLERVEQLVAQHGQDDVLYFP
ncbi:hypothetical protein DV096_00425 [Bradymonadaceae bacterium TMQ3]|nr:hypothetical protein DV096_00425 [Bradymonadaceae bacterium TMQ3]TXC78175.1 hypothetical protein FRC91_05460 [Bradymonadales bacterium TMQ1]